MKIKNAVTVIAAAMLLTSMLAGCEKPVSLGTGASTIKVDRGAYLAQKSSVKTEDISNVISFIDAIESIAGDIGDYTTSYDPETNTVYATTESGNLAFYLDDEGYVLFASANGTPDVKEKLNRAIVQVTVGNAFAHGINDIFNTPEQKRWLNQINAQVVRAETLNQDVEIESLDSSLMEIDTTALDSLVSSDLGRDVFNVGMATMPVLTETLEEYGIQDLTHYYEAPTLSKFWQELDSSDMEEEIAGIVEAGKEMGDQFDTTLEQPGEEVPEWSLGSYELPDSFGDGTSTELGKETADAYEGFYSSLKEWRDQVFADEETAQKEGIANITGETVDDPEDSEGETSGDKNTEDSKETEEENSDYWDKYTESLEGVNMIDMPNMDITGGALPPNRSSSSD